MYTIVSSAASGSLNVPDTDETLYADEQAALDQLALHAGTILRDGYGLAAFTSPYELHVFVHEYGDNPAMREHYILRVEETVTIDMSVANALRTIGEQERAHELCTAACVEEFPPTGSTLDACLDACPPDPHEDDEERDNANIQRMYAAQETRNG